MDPASFATAYGLSTSIGLRPFMTLAIASIAMHFGYLHVAPAFAFLGSDGAAWLLAALAALEFCGDKIPVVDHALHAFHIGIKPVAAAILVGGALGGSGGFTDAAMGLAALNALGVHAGVTAARGASSAMTLGIANPFISLTEDVVAFGATLLAIALPFAGAAVALVIGFAALGIVLSAYGALRNRASAGAPPPSSAGFGPR
jgi:hypothetical protein